MSGDRVDVVYRTPREIVVIEVKSRDSNWPDLQRGVYQCVKYRAVMEAQEARPEGSGRAVRAVRAVLVTECELPAALERIVKRLDVTHIRVRRPVVDTMRRDAPDVSVHASPSAELA